MADTRINLIITAKDSASSVIKGFSGKVSSGAQQMASSIVAMGTVGTASILALGAAGLKAAGDFEQLRISFTTMLGGGEKGLKKANALMKQLTEFSAKTPFELAEIARSAKSLLAFGFAADKIQPTLRRLGDVSAGLNIPIQELAELYGKARVQGRLFAEDINQLTGRGIPIITELAKVMGISESKVRDMVEAGKVGFPQLEKAFANMTNKGGKFAGLMEAQSKSLFGIISTLKDNISLALQEIVEKTGLFDLVKQFVNNLTKVMDKNKGRIIDFFIRVKDSIVDFVQYVEDNKDTFVPFAKNIGLVTAAVAGLSIAVGILNSTMLPIIAVIASIAAIMTMWQRNTFGLRDTILGIVEVISNMLAPTINEIRNAFAAAWPEIQKAFDEFRKALGDTKDLQVILKVIAGIVATVLVAAFMYAKNALISFIKSLDDVIRIVTGVIKILSGMGEFLVGLFTLNFKKIADANKKIWGGIGDVIVGSIKGAVNGVISVINGFIDAYNNLRSTINKAPGPDLPKIGKINFLARGTNRFAGGMAVVGDNGPELVTLPRGSQVKTASQTKDLMRTPQPSTSVTINVHVPLMMSGEADKRRVAEEIWKALAQLAQSRGMSANQLLGQPI